MDTLPPESAPATAVGVGHARQPLQPVAAVLALAIPGLGHLYLGFPRRAMLIGGGVLGLFFGGIFIGGIDVVDRREDFVWFVGQSLVGPVAFGVDYLHQRHFKVVDLSASGGLRSARPDEYRDPATGRPVPIHPDPTAGGAPTARISDASGQMRNVSPAYPPNVKSLARMNDMGTLFATIAGMLNLIAIIDAGMGHRRRNDRAGDIWEER